MYLSLFGLLNPASQFLPSPIKLYIYINSLASFIQVSFRKSDVRWTKMVRARILSLQSHHSKLWGISSQSSHKSQACNPTLEICNRNLEHLFPVLKTRPPLKLRYLVPCSFRLYLTADILSWFRNRQKKASLHAPRMSCRVLVKDIPSAGLIWYCCEHWIPRFFFQTWQCSWGTCSASSFSFSLLQCNQTFSKIYKSWLFSRYFEPIFDGNLIND